MLREAEHSSSKLIFEPESFFRQLATLFIHSSIESLLVLGVGADPIHTASRSGNTSSPNQRTSTDGTYFCVKFTTTNS